MLVVTPVVAEVQELCMYQDASGVITQVRGRANIPPEYVAGSKCFVHKQKEYLAPPAAIELSGALRKVHLSTSLGRVELRWQRAVEQLFGRTPERAVVDAMRTVSRAVKQNGFPQHVRTLFIDWNIVFLDENLPETQIPATLVSNCHPAWMTPPTNLYIVAQRVAAGCNGRAQKHQTVADAELTEVLLHEIGHAIEVQLLGAQFAGDRSRAEGFATWFEQYAADFSQIIPAGTVRRAQLKRAFQLAEAGRLPQSFHGDSDSYIAAALPFYALVNKRRVFGLMELYSFMKERRVSFARAITNKAGWSDRRLAEEISAIVAEGKP